MTRWRTKREAVWFEGIFKAFLCRLEAVHEYQSGKHEESHLIHTRLPKIHQHFATASHASRNMKKSNDWVVWIKLNKLCLHSPNYAWTETSCGRSRPALPNRGRPPLGSPGRRQTPRPWSALWRCGGGVWAVERSTTAAAEPRRANWKRNREIFNEKSAWKWSSTYTGHILEVIVCLPVIKGLIFLNVLRE